MEKKKGKKRWIAVVIIAAVLVTAGLGSCMKSLSTSIQMQDTSIETLEVERRDLYDDISVSGTVESENIIKVTSMLNAKVAVLNVEVGSQVQEGDILCVFDSSDLQTEYDTLLAAVQKSDGMSENTHKINLRNLESAKTERDAALTQAQQAIDDAVAARDRAYDKYNQYIENCNQISGELEEIASQMNAAEDPDHYAVLAEQYQKKAMELQSAETMRDSMEEQLPASDAAIRSAEDSYASVQRSADASVQNCQDALDAEQYSEDSSTRTQLEKLQSQIDACTVKAPASGIVTSLNIAQGSIPTTDALMTIEDAEKLKISVKIGESDILKVQEGMHAVVKTNATGEEEYSATVTRVINIFSGSEESGGYAAEISIDNASTDLLIGMRAKARIVLAEKRDVLTVPYESVVEEDDGTTIVYVAEEQADGTRVARAVPVTIGMETGYYVEVTGGDLKEGDRVVLSADAVTEGDIIPASGYDAMIQDGTDHE